jgi:hypothetical protein
VVTSQTTSSTVWAVSAPDSGYSVDDLAPAAPAVAEARRTGDAVTLSWGAVDALDLAAYVVVRGTSADFAPAAGIVLGETTALTWTDPASPGGAFYRVLARDVHGNASASPAIAGGGDAVPLVLALTAPRPNPSRGGIAFDVLLPKAGAVTLSIVDARGRIVRVLERGTLPAGRHAYAWDARTRPAGVYVVRLETADGVKTRKVTVTR